MSDTSSDRTAAGATPIAANDAEKSARSSQQAVDEPQSQEAKTKMTHEEKEAAKTGWRSEVQEIPKQVGCMANEGGTFTGVPGLCAGR